MQIIDIASLLSIIGVLTVVTNLIVEVLKKILPVPANILAVLFAEVVTLAAFFGWADKTGLDVLWYYVVAAVIVGFMVAYAAMFGYDKLKETLLKMTERPK